MKRAMALFLLCAALLCFPAACGPAPSPDAEAGAGLSSAPEGAPAAASGDTLTPGTETYRGFVLDNVLHSEQEGDIHFHLYVPDQYDGSTSYALFLTLPGYEGLYFQGVGVNLQAEAFAFEALRYQPDMIVAAPQLGDWQEPSARQTIALTEYLLSHYQIDPERVNLEGMSGGGETGSLVMGLRPELYTAYLAVSTRWDGALEPLVDSETPVYLAVGAQDSYYGSQPLRQTYAELCERYAQKGLPPARIEELVVLDVRGQDFFTQHGYTDQHAGGQAFALDPAAMGWLFDQ